MTWLLAIALALAALALAAFAFRVVRTGWTAFAAALALGLAGYALQASPGVPGAPSAPAAGGEEGAWALVDERKEMIGGQARSTNDKVLVADAFARRGQYANAAAMLRAAVNDNPRDAEAWLALGNALVEHADGALTQPALLAYRRAAEPKRNQPVSVAMAANSGMAISGVSATPKASAASITRRPVASADVSLKRSAPRSSSPT